MENITVDGEVFEARVYEDCGVADIEIGVEFEGVCLSLNADEATRIADWFTNIANRLKET